MIFPYHDYHVLPTPGHSAGALSRPMVPIRVIGPRGSQVVLALADTGSDVTVLPSFLLPVIGAEEGPDEHAHFRGVGGQLVTAEYRTVTLQLACGDARYEWTASVGFIDGHNVAVLGHAAFLTHFQATFNSERKRLTLKPNKEFPGTAVED